MAVPILELKTGDIVIVSGPRPVVHRIVKVYKADSALTKGDLSLRLDLPVSKDRLVGKVSAIVRKGNKPVSMQGKLWRIENYLIARYSLAYYLAWSWASRNKWLARTTSLLSIPVKLIYVFVLKLLSGTTSLSKG